MDVSPKLLLAGINRLRFRHLPGRAGETYVELILDLWDFTVPSGHDIQQKNSPTAL